MKLTLNLRLLLILLAVLVTFTSCKVGEKPDQDTGSETASETAAATEESTTEAETESELSEYRASISRSRSELEEMLTLQDSEFEEAHQKLKAFEELAVVSSDYDAVDAVYMEFEDLFFHIDTQVSIASLIYNMDTTDEAASSRYLDSYALYGDLYNAYIESCKNVYNSTPIRDELFADWTEEDIEELFAYDPQTQELRELNEALLVELNALSDEEFYDRSAEIYAELVQNNNKIAKFSGYDNYYLYASEKIYGRDYGVEDIDLFTKYVMLYFLPNEPTLLENWQSKYTKFSQARAQIMYNYLFEPFDTLQENYVENYINSFEGSMYDGLSHMFANRNVVFASSANSHPSAYQTYLREIETPFCLFGINGQSTTTLIHEMGHYYAALYNEDVYSFDLAETQSQANEMLFLAYVKKDLASDIYAAVRGYTLYNFVIQSIVCVLIDEFEREVYALESVEGYTSEDFDAIMEKVCSKYVSVEYLNQNIVDINQYWRLTATNSAVYYISYAVSMTEALCIFSAVEEDSEAGRELYRMLIEEIDENDGFLEAVNKIGLASPFEGETFEDILAALLK